MWGESEVGFDLYIYLYVVYIYIFDIIHQHLMAAGGREPAHFFTLV